MVVKSSMMHFLQLRLLLLVLMGIFLINTEVTMQYNVDEGSHVMEELRKYFGEGSIHPSECGARCSYRCSATSHRKPCLFFCKKCCAKCECVPPGTYGNKEVCPCYDNWKTQQGGPKCP